MADMDDLEKESMDKAKDTAKEQMDKRLNSGQQNQDNQGDQQNP